MNYNHGQEIAVNELRMKVAALRDRLVWSLLLGVSALLLLIVFAAPKSLLANVGNYIWTLLQLEIRKLPMFEVRKSDLLAVAQASELIANQNQAWLAIGGISFFVFAASFGLFTYAFLKKGEREKLDRVMRGAQLVTPKIHNKIMKAEYGSKPPLEMGKQLTLGTEKAIVPEALQYLHFAFAGASGSGKSTAIEELIQQALKRGDKGFVIDLNGAFYSKYGRPGDHVLSVRDPRGEPWDFWHEQWAEPENMAAALIESDGSTTPYFWKGARALLASLIRQNNSVEDLFSDFQKSSAELREKLTNAGELSPQILGKDGDQSDGVIGSTVLDLGILRELNQWNKSSEFFSITDWINNNTDRSWTYVLLTDKDVEACKPLLRVWFDLACLAVLQRDAGDTRNLHTWLIIDEMKTVGQLPSLPSILDKGRKYKASVVLGFQAISQIKKIYGDEDAKSILQGIQNQFFFRMSEVESAEYVSDAMGEHDVEQVSYGMSFGATERSERGSLSRAKARKKIIMSDEVRSLKTLEAFSKLCGHQPFRIRFDLKSRPRLMRPAISEKNPENQPKATSNEKNLAPKEIEVRGQQTAGIPFFQPEEGGRSP